MERKDKVLKILRKIKNQEYYYLGEGFSSVVFHDHVFVYKVFVTMSSNLSREKELSCCFLKKNKALFCQSQFFYPVKIIEKINDVVILVYRYEESMPLNEVFKDELIDFLVECWQKKIIVKDIKKENFRRAGSCLKFVDYEISEYNDNLFLNMICRTFIMLSYFDSSPEYIKKLNRSSINQFDLPELKGFQDFCNKVFARIILNESFMINSMYFQKPEKVVPFADEINAINSIEENSRDSFFLSFSNSINLKKIFYQMVCRGFYITDITSHGVRFDENNYFSPEVIGFKGNKVIDSGYKVSLVIKACSQDSPSLYQQVLHIIKQISFPDKFYERIIAIDRKDKNFLRQYTEAGSLKELYEVVERLRKENLIDKIIELPLDEVEKVNERWFGLPVTTTHTLSGVPVAPQLYAFEMARGDYVLQMDSDVMIGRRDYSHSFLKEMIEAIESNDKVISVGFNIYHSGSSKFNPYHGYEDGGFVPEVRFGLFHRERLLSMRPLNNRIKDGCLELSWFRSLHEKQKESGFVSLRGGSPLSFYIHPQNYRKEDKDVWFTILDRVEKCIIPECQSNNYDLFGSYYDWTIEKRKEPLIVITLVRNIEYGRFLRMWLSVISQTYKDWGMVLIDDASTNGLDFFIEHIIKPYNNKVTYIKNRFPRKNAANTYKAIHYFTENRNSVILTLDGDDALIGSEVFQEIMDEYNYKDADMVIGKMYRTDKLTAHYKYRPNFISPRLYGGNVWQHLRSFKKYLFDSLSIYDLKVEPEKKSSMDEAALLSCLGKKKRWVESCGDYAIMVPITEMAENPLIMDNFNYFFDRTTEITPELRRKKDSIISQLLAKRKKTKQDVHNGRKQFLPDLNMIEIDITYKCNLKCINCNRSCTQAPSSAELPVSTIREFIRESIELEKEWKVISILGGEPTLHSNFTEIINLILSEYIQKYSGKTVLKIVSNGYSKKTREILEGLPASPHIIIDAASFKTGKKVGYFTPFNRAPIDEEDGAVHEYSKGCWVTAYCGIGLNFKGYYVCSVAGGIDRIWGFNKGIQKLEDLSPDIKKQLSVFCPYCGNFTDYAVNAGDFIPRCEKAVLLQEICSESWRARYEKYNRPRIR